jgi:hypothetical protein
MAGYAWTLDVEDNSGAIDRSSRWSRGHAEIR